MKKATQFFSEKMHKEMYPTLRMDMPTKKSSLIECSHDRIIKPQRSTSRIYYQGK